MTESTPDPRHPTRTPEQQDAIRRRALPVASCGVICGVAGMALMMTNHVGPFNPPNLIGSNLAICALLMGVGILFYARGTTGTRPAAILSVVAILLGMFGPVFFAVQTISYRQQAEGRELETVRLIATGSRDYAAAHNGNFPPDLLALIEDNRIQPIMLQSPFGSPHKLFTDAAFAEARKKLSRDDLLKNVETESDYLYLGSDIKLPSPTASATAASQPAATTDTLKDIIIGSSNAAIMRVNLALSFADGSTRFITADDSKKVMEDCNAARAKLGLGILRPPEVIQHAIEEAAAAATQSGSKDK